MRSRSVNALSALIPNFRIVGNQETIVYSSLPAKFLKNEVPNNCGFLNFKLIHRPTGPTLDTSAIINSAITPVRPRPDCNI
jgi:hypothetical protein